MIHGDCVEATIDIPDNSIDFGIHSPPFANLYIYSDSEADMGNCASSEEFFDHYKFLIPELYRVTVPGRCCAVHCKDLPKYANRDGTAGLIDFPGQIIAAFESCGWSFHSRITIWKCPVTERERTNNNGLLHKTVKRDRSQLRQGMADYLIAFRKPPVGTLLSDKPVNNAHRSWDAVANTELSVDRGFLKYIGEKDLDPRDSTFHPSPYARTSLSSNGDDADSINIWRRYAEPVWWDLPGVDPLTKHAATTLANAGWGIAEINSVFGLDETDAVWFDICQTNVLNAKRSTGTNDERHICPLQIDLIRRAVQIWSNPGDVVLSPFGGIGSEGYGSILEERKFIGIELKESYFKEACVNLREATKQTKLKRLF